MINKKSKSGIKNLILMLFSAVLLIVALLGTTTAWFTAENSAELEGHTPEVVVNLKKDTSTAWSANDTYTYSSGAFSTFGFNTNGSNINTYVRVRVTCEYTSGDMSLGSPFSALTFTLNGSWKSNDNAATTDNAKLQSGWIYYCGASGSTLAEVAPSSTLINLFSGVTGSVSESVNVKIYVEAVQANATGLAKWTGINA